MSVFNHFRKYPNALDELQSHITPEQFDYLLSILSSADNLPHSTPITTADPDDDDSIISPGTSWRSSSGDDSLPSSTGVHVVQCSGRHSRKYEIVRQQEKEFNRSQTLGASSNQLVLPLSSKLSGRPGLLQLASFDSTLTTTANTGGEESSISRFGVTSKDSVMALQRVPLSVEESLLENVQLAQSKYSEVGLPLVMFQGTKVGGNVGGSESTAHEMQQKSCSRLPVCKRIMGKYMMASGRESLSSSVESVKAESLPDLNNQMAEIAGKIANEPVNPFPIFRKPASRRTSRTGVGSTGKRAVGARATGGTLDIHRIEKDIERELDAFQDYKNVSEFFSQNKKSQTKAKGGTGAVNVSNLSRRVTNPLYKVYDPAGYQKSEDELALECIQMICDDFNKWIKSLADKKRKSEDDKGHRESEDEFEVGQDDEGEGDKRKDISIIGPEFLIQILRKELELPEKSS